MATRTREETKFASTVEGSKHKITKKKAAKVAARAGYGVAATWYVRTGPTGSKKEKMARRGAAAAVGVGIFKGKDIKKGAQNLVAKRREKKNGIRNKNINNAHSTRRVRGTHKSSRKV